MAKKIMPTNYFMMLLVLSIVVHFVLPVFQIIRPPFSYSGVLFIVFGAIINVWTDNLFKKVHTTVKPHRMPTTLTTSGPFRISRHPMYLGMTSILLGVSFLCGSFITFLSPIFYMVIMEAVFIPMEEKNLASQFGDEYVDYRKRVRRWV